MYVHGHVFAPFRSAHAPADVLKSLRHFVVVKLSEIQASGLICPKEGRNRGK